ncbi:MAG TPA: chemotaxis protein CheB [Pseudoxanthomonas sp.]|nr:chemotaxis protein CheB [Pseudoxanthomonas sp.]
MLREFAPENGKVVVMGASLGGVEALLWLAAHMPADFPAPLVVVLHIGMQRSAMPELLSASGPLPAHHAMDGDCMKPGHIYFGPSDRHVLVEGPILRLCSGPKEHHTRPAVDPLFRSAALSRGRDVIGVVLTGMLDDGTAGLQAIKACGGTAVVQDPADAAAPSMPLSALRHVEVDHCRPLAGMPALLDALVAQAHDSAGPHAGDAALPRHEHKLFLMEGHPMDHLPHIAVPSTFACPDCHGSLWELSGTTPLRYRCHTGHAFTLRSLVHAQCQGTDEAVWSAVRAMQERQLLMERTAAEALRMGDSEAADRARIDAHRFARIAQAMQELLERAPVLSE